MNTNIFAMTKGMPSEEVTFRKNTMRKYEDKLLTVKKIKLKARIVSYAPFPGQRLSDLASFGGYSLGGDSPPILWVASPHDTQEN